MHSASPHRRHLGERVAGVLLCTLLFSGIANASEEFSVSAGSSVTIGVETELMNPTYSWVLSMNGQILETQADRFFHGVIPSVGTANVELVIRSADGAEELHSMTVQSVQPVEIDPAASSIVRAVLRTVPPMSATDHRVALPQEGGVLVLHLDESTGAIREYHVDAHTSVDSDGDGVADNDADNRVHPSFFEGSSFPISVVPAVGETERTMQLRVFGTQGELSDARVVLTFDPVIPVTPILHTIPLRDSSSQSVVLPVEGGMIEFDASDSTGGVQQYMLDLDVDRDANGDGNPANDNDAAGTAFERTGEPLTMLIRPRGATARRIQLTAINRSGQSSVLTLPVRFGEGAVPLPPVQGGVRLSSSVPSPVVSQEFSLTVEGIPAGTMLYEWDLQSDGQADTTTSVPVLLLRPDAAGVLPVRVTLRDAAGAMLTIAQAEFTVRNSLPSDDGTPPQVGEGESLRIDVTTEGNAVSFQPIIDPSIDQTKIYSTWDFGDGTKSYLLTPTHGYAEAGTYDVSLSLTDAATGREVASTTSSVTVRAAAEPTDTPTNGGAIGGIFRALGFMFKVALFVFLLLLLISAVAIGFFYVAAKNEGISLKEKLRAYVGTFRGEEAEVAARPVPEILGAASLPKKTSDEPAPMKLVAEDVTPPAPKPPIVQQPPTPPKPPIPAAPSPSPVPAKPVEKATPPVQAESAQLPPWLKTPPQSPSVQPQTVPTPDTAVLKPPVVQQPPVPPKQPVSQPPMPPVKAPVSSPRPVQPQVTPPTIAPSSPKPPVSPQPAQEVMPVETLTTSASASAPVPAWLQQGLAKTAEEPKAPPSSLPVEAASALPPPQPVPELEMPDDEPIAMLRAELPEDGGDVPPVPPAQT